MQSRLVLVSLCLCAPALAGPLGSGFTAGSIEAAGFPDPLVQSPGNYLALKSGSGGGSTGGGFAGFAFSDAGISDAPDGATISLQGLSSHFNFDGFTASYSSEPLVLALTRPTRFAITDISGTIDGPLRMVTFEPLSGVIDETGPGVGTLSAGTYAIRYGVGSGFVNQFGPTVLSEWFSGYGDDEAYGSTLDWKMRLSPVPESYALGNFAPAASYFVQGQSFTPSSFGDVWTPPEPSSTPALAKLRYFTIAYDFSYSSPLPVLYIFDAPPTPEAAASGAGSRATGVHIGGGTYAFDGVTLDFHTRYYAVLPQAAAIFDGGGDPYPGGVDMFIRADLDPVVIGEGYGTFDLGFSADFDFLPGCPADLNRDGFVDDADFVAFASGYSVLECLDAAMPPNCPANLDSDLFVDDADFVVFATAYNDLICP